MKKTGSNKNSSFAEIYSDYFVRVFNAVYTKIGNREDTGDVCQDIFMILFENFEKAENPRKYINGIMKNRVRRYYEQKRPEDDIDNLFNDISLTFVNGFRDTRIIIEEAIEGIEKDAIDEAILDLVAFNNYSYSDTGRVLGISKRKTGYRYNILVKRITDYLGTKGIDNIEDLL